MFKNHKGALNHEIFQLALSNLHKSCMGYENLSLQNFSHILKNKMAAIANSLKIIKVF